MSNGSSIQASVGEAAEEGVAIIKADSCIELTRSVAGVVNLKLASLDERVPDLEPELDLRIRVQRHCGCGRAAVIRYSLSEVFDAEHDTFRKVFCAAVRGEDIL